MDECAHRTDGEDGMAEITSMVGESILQLYAAVDWSLGNVVALLDAAFVSLIAAGQLIRAATLENIWFWAALGGLTFRDLTSGR
jgi:hypothetical protein